MSLEEACLIEETWDKSSSVWDAKTEIIEQTYDASKMADIWKVRFPNGEIQIYTVNWDDGFPSIGERILDC